MFFAAVIATAVACGHASAAQDPLGRYPPGYTATGPNGYVYVPPSYGAVPPLYGYGYGGYGYGGFGYGGFGYGYGLGSGYYGRAYWPPPAGFGSPFYNGYNDPNYPLYGPGVREFLNWGGADFYGW